MLPLNKSNLCILSSIVLLLSMNSQAQNNELFRTPAKMYAGAYTVKIQLKKGFTEYDVPMWVKPDQADSTIDPSLLKELGYVDKEIVFDQVKLSGELLEKKTFKPQKTEWAFVPDFAKACCFGVIGRDILQNFQIRFDPKPSAHLEWNRLAKNDQASSIMKPAFIADLRKLFSLTQILDVPVVLNIQERSMKMEGRPEKPVAALFSFFFVPPERVIQVTSILAKEKNAASKAGLKVGAVLTKLNGEKISELDRWVIEEYLRGKKSNTIQLITKDKKEIKFDFTTRQFETKSLI